MIKQILILLVLVFAFPKLVFAHAVVKPSEVKPSSFNTFVLGVPNEGDVTTTQIKLVLPEGLNFVSPTVKPNWQIETNKAEDGEVKEITWKAGGIPPGFRDEFSFSAQAPSKEGQLSWKVYQTYQDGRTVSWDQDPEAISEGDDDFSSTGPFSVTKIVESLPVKENLNQKQYLPLALSIVALALGALSLIRLKNNV